MVFVELPEVGQIFSAGDECAVVESVKSASDLYAPVSGEVTAVNEELADAPEILNQDSYEKGWIFRMTPTNEVELDELLDAEAYAEIIEE
jgi:glycine cleavage system H protein